MIPMIREDPMKQKSDTDKSEKPVAPPQPKCSGCNHPISFHRSGQCMVMGCICKKWNGPKVLLKKEREALRDKLIAQAEAAERRKKS
jgi:hypothetical protein